MKRMILVALLLAGCGASEKSPTDAEAAAILYALQAAQTQPDCNNGVIVNGQCVPLALPGL
jgi:hypothetical protein